MCSGLAHVEMCVQCVVVVVADDSACTVLATTDGGTRARPASVVTRSDGRSPRIDVWLCSDNRRATVVGNDDFTVHRATHSNRRYWIRVSTGTNRWRAGGHLKLYCRYCSDQ